VYTHPALKRDNWKEMKMGEIVGLILFVFRIIAALGDWLAGSNKSRELSPKENPRNQGGEESP
jgi:hypothetical protein